MIRLKTFKKRSLLACLPQSIPAARNIEQKAPALHAAKHLYACTICIVYARHCLNLLWVWTNDCGALSGRVDFRLQLFAALLSDWCVFALTLNCVSMLCSSPFFLRLDSKLAVALTPELKWPLKSHHRPFRHRTIMMILYASVATAIEHIRSETDIV